jgi:glucose/arabinose dehydrogenase
MSKFFSLFVVACVVVAVGWFVFAGYIYFSNFNFNFSFTPSGNFVATETRPTSSPSLTSNATSTVIKGQVLAGELPTIAVLTALSSNKILLGTITGQIFTLDFGRKSVLIDDLNLRRVGENGLTSIVLDSDFKETGRYLAQYYYRNDQGEVKAKIERREADLSGGLQGNKSLQIVVADLTAGLLDAGFGLLKNNDFYYYFSGDQGRPILATDQSSIVGKIIKTKDLGAGLVVENNIANGLRNPKLVTTFKDQIYFIDLTLPNLNRLYHLKAEGGKYGWPVDPICEVGEFTLACFKAEISALTATSLSGKPSLVLATKTGDLLVFNLTERKITKTISTPYNYINQLTVAGDWLILTTNNRGTVSAGPEDNQLVAIPLRNFNDQP